MEQGLPVARLIETWNYYQNLFKRPDKVKPLPSYRLNCRQGIGVEWIGRRP
jgi:hypothetical protein